MGSHWLIAPTINYYRDAWKLQGLGEAKRGSLDGSPEYDYYAHFSDQGPQGKSVKTLRVCGETQLVLFRRLQR